MDRPGTRMDRPGARAGHPNSGFTLVELLAAMALTAVLMLAVLHVVGSLGRSRMAMERRAAAANVAPWREDLIETLRRDLGGAAGLRYVPNGVVLAGHAALRRASLAPADEPVTVSYGLTEIHGRTWLCRRQVARDGYPGGDEPWTELVCPDVTAFEVTPATTAAVTLDAAAQAKSEFQPVPAAASVRVTLADRSVLEQVLVLR